MSLDVKMEIPAQEPEAPATKAVSRYATLCGGHPTIVRRLDMVATVALAIAAFIAGHAYVQRSIEAGQHPQFYQENFGPAVSLACGTAIRHQPGARFPSWMLSSR